MKEVQIQRERFLAPKYVDLDNIVEQLSLEYRNALPFPNISLDNFFNEGMLEEVLNEFPDLSKLQSDRMQSINEYKFAGKSDEFFGEKTREFMQFLNSRDFLIFIQKLTSISETLIGDPYFFGAGQHQIKRGGFLKVHADFNTHKLFGLDRRVNALVYLNKDWKEEYGGHFELWNKTMTKCEKKILPIFNTLAIFSTTDYSFHGHPDPLNCPEDRSRKSLALYYYSDGRPAEEKNRFKNDFQQEGTLFVTRKEKDGEMKWINAKRYAKILVDKFWPF